MAAFRNNHEVLAERRMLRDRIVFLLFAFRGRVGATESCAIERQRE
jgi:hypothetical protein